MGRVAHGGEVVVEPVQTPLRLQLLHHDAVHLRQIDHVVGSVFQLGGGKGPARPVGERVALLQVHAAQAVHQRPVADLLGVAQKSGRHLGIEQGRRQNAQLAIEDLQILASGVEELHDGRVGKQRGEHLHVLDGEGIHDGHFRIRSQLNEAEVRIVGLLAQKLRINGQDRRRGRSAHEGLQVFLACNVFHDGPCL